MILNTNMKRPKRKQYILTGFGFDFIHLSQQSHLSIHKTVMEKEKTVFAICQHYLKKLVTDSRFWHDLLHS